MIKWCFGTFCFTLLVLFANAQPVMINEVMSSNKGALYDVDGDAPDWIEFYNPGPDPVNLKGFGISDQQDDLSKWVFPDYVIGPEQYLVVFASGKDRRDVPLSWSTIVAEGDDWKYLTPTSEPASNWRLSGYNDVNWLTGRSGFGYGDNDDNTQLSTSNSVVFLRKSFQISNPEAIQSIIFHMDYDDGFVAYLNGVEIARSNMTGRGDYPRFNVLASANHEAVMYSGQLPEMFKRDDVGGILKTGENILAVQVHNNSTVSSDLTAIPFLSLGSTQPFGNPRKIDFLKLPENNFHTNFKIDADGESIYLTSSEGSIVDSIHVVPLGLNTSYGRTPGDHSVWGIFPISTPGAENTGEILSGETVDEPLFSLEGGIYASGVKVSVYAPDRIDSVYFTLDGSEPSKNSPRATREIDITSSKVVKARVIKTGAVPGKVVTNSYIIYDTKNLPVVSLSLNPADLWDYNTGIYVLGPNAETANPNFGANFWQDWEKACHIELIEPSGIRPVNQDAGVKIFGNWSRANAQKSLVIHNRKSYGPEHIKYKLFDNRPFDEFKSIVLRNSGNDWNNTMFRDGLMSSLTIGMNFDQMAYRPSIIFLNGEYWGIQNIREKIDEHFIASNDGVDPDKVILLENNAQVLIGSADDWWTMYNFVENNSMSIESNYDKVAQQLDMSSFIDYYSTQIFYANWDWPGNNIRYWKTTDPMSKWRYIMFDTDFGLGIWNTKAPTENSLEQATTPNGPGWPNPPWSTLLLRKLLENNGFRNQFVNRFADLMNSTLLPARINEAIDQKRDAIRDEIGFHLMRWGGGSQSSWLSIVQSMKNFVTERPYNVFIHIQQKFGFQTPQRIIVQSDAEKGTIQLNSLRLSTFPWSGSYFQEVPITLTAVPNAGYRFLKWEGVTTNSNSATITISPKSRMEIRAVFESDGSHYDNIVINEISFNNQTQPDPGDWIEIYNKGLEDINLSGWKLTDSDTAHYYFFPEGTWLKSTEYLVVSNDQQKLKSVFGDIKQLIGNFGFGLGNTTDAVKLYSAQGDLIDEVDYSNVTPWKRFDLTALWSLELIDPAKNNNSGTSWDFSLKYGTPGLKNDSYIFNKTEDLASPESTNILSQNYPNPFSEGTYIEFRLKNPGMYHLQILDLNGRLVRSMTDGNDLYQQHSIYWDGRDQYGKPVASGVYFYKVESGGYSEMKRMVKLK